MSVHVIVPFAIPKHWPWYCWIDPGGSAPWGVGIARVDESGNKVVTSSAEEIYTKTRINPNEVVRWVRDNTPIERCRFTIDYQNVPVMTLFQDAGIHCEPAMKDVKVGLDGAMAQFWVNPERDLPAWFRATQPKERVAAFEGKGAPQVYVFDSCKSFIKEHDNYLWDPEKKNVPKKGQADHHCFVAGTMIETKLGPRPIESLRIGDEVLTRKGYRKVINWGPTGKRKVISRLGLVGTPDHPVITLNRGKVHLDAIRYDDILFVCQSPKTQHIEELSTNGFKGDATTGIQTRSVASIGFTSSEDALGSIGMYGCITTDQFLKDMTSITETTIPETTSRRISTVFPNTTIIPITERDSVLSQSTWLESARSRRSGMHRLKGLNGTANTLLRVASDIPNQFLTSVGNAGRNVADILTQSFAPIIANPLGAGPQGWTMLFAPVHIAARNSLSENIQSRNVVRASALKDSELREVFNLTVEGEHEYFANGILVSNCDGFRYFLASNPQSAVGIIHDPYAAFRESDPTSAVHLDQVQRELRRLRAKDAAAAERNADPDGFPGDEPNYRPRFISEFGGYY